MNLNTPHFQNVPKESDLQGIGISAGLLFGLGCLWGFYAVFFALLEIAGPRHTRWSVKPMLTIVLIGLLSWLCIRAARALRETRQWGAYVAIVFGILLLLFVGRIINDMYHPERQVNDEGYALLLTPFIAGVGLWWCVYLNLPRVRSRLASKQLR